MARIYSGTLPAALIAAALTAVPAAHLHAQDTPKRKPGLWQQTLTTSGPGMPPQSMSICIDAKTDDLIASRAEDSQQCSQQSIRRQGDGFAVEAVCKEGATTIRTRGSFRGDFSTRYSGELRSTFEPPMNGMKEATQRIEARWIGPCKPGQKPGDVMLDGMGGMNMNELMNADPQKMQEMMQKMQQMQQNRAK